jgi:hypothetical protein
MTTETKQFRAPTADGRMMYPFAAFPLTRAEWVTPVDTIKAPGGYHAPTLLIVAADVTEIQYRTPNRREVIGYTRIGTNDAFPAQLTADAWEEFRDSLGYDDENDVWIAARLYDTVLADQEYTIESLDLSGYSDLPADILDPASVSDPDGTFEWEVGAPYLVFGSAYSNAMPGALTNIRERLAKEVEKQVPHAKIWTHKAREGVVDGIISLRYEDSRTYPVKVGRKTTQRLSSKDYSFSFPIPIRIVALSKAEAIAQFDAMVTEISGSIDAAGFVACSHCNGDGVVVR